MKRLPVVDVVNDVHGLRLLALGRIQRCAGCPRYEALVSAHLGDRLESGRPGSVAALPGIPAECHFQVCSPMVARYAWDRPAGHLDPPGTHRAVAS